MLISLKVLSGVGINGNLRLNQAAAAIFQSSISLLLRTFPCCLDLASYINIVIA